MRSKIMKRVVASAGILAILVVFFSGMTGCARREREVDERIALRWVSDPNPARQEQIALFEEVHPGIRIDLDWASVGLESILVQIAGGNPPDLFDIHSPVHFNIFAERGVLLDVTPYVEKHQVDLADFWPQCKPWMIHQDRVYAFPTNATPFVLFYNRRLFDEAGVDHPDETWTWEDMLEAAKKLTRVDPVTGRAEQFGILWEEPDILIWQNRGNKFTPDGRRSTINSPEAKEAVRFMYDLRFTYHVMPTPSEMMSMASATGWGWGGLNLFAGESIAMLPLGRWGIIQFRRNKDLDWDIAPLPKRKEGVERANLFLTRTTGISRDTKHPEAAFKFLYFLRSEEYNKLVSRGGDSLPASISMAKSDIFLHDPDHPRETRNQLYLDQLKYARNREVSPYVCALEVERITVFEYERMWARVQTPEETLDNIARRINALIEENLANR